MKSFVYLLCFSPLFFSCTPQPPQQLTVPFQNLEGPIPPITPLDEKTTNKALLTKLLLHPQNEEDTKEICIKLLEDYLQSSNRQVVLAALGAYSLLQLHLPEHISEKLILEDSDPYIQLQLLSTLYTTQSPCSSKIFKKALMCVNPYLQLYATRFLAEERDKQTISIVESLEAKVPTELLPFCAELYAMESSPKAQGHLKRIFLSENSSSVALCLRLVRDFQLMELYNDIGRFTPVNTQEQEAYAYALGAQNSLDNTTKLQELLKNHDPIVSLQAAISLTEFGEKEPIIVSTLSPYLLASAFKTSLSTQELEALWTKALDETERLNLAISLIERHSSLPLTFLFTKLEEGENLLFTLNYSQAGTCYYLSQSIPAKSDMIELLQLEFVSQTLQEELVHKMATFFPDEFLKIAPKALLEHSTHLAPTVLSEIAQLKSEQSLQLLKELSFKPGQPFIRQVALFLRLQEAEIKLDPKIIKPILSHLRESLHSLSRPTWFSFFQQRPMEEKTLKQRTEQQQLYFAAISALAQTKTEESARILLEEIESAPESLTPLVTAALLYSLL